MIYQALKVMRIDCPQRKVDDSKMYPKGVPGRDVSDVGNSGVFVETRERLARHFRPTPPSRLV